MAFFLLEPGKTVPNRQDCVWAFSVVNREVSKVALADVLQRRGLRRWRRLAQEARHCGSRFCFVAKTVGNGGYVQRLFL